ncbi:MAG: hypothetical protein AB1611_13685 [bacterium]
MSNKKLKLYLCLLVILLAGGILVGNGGQLVAATGSETKAALPAIAVLPFENLSGQFGASEEVMAGLKGLLQKEFSLVSDKQVEAVLAELQVRHTGFLTTGQIIEIGKRLKVETLLLGMIDTYRQRPVPQVSFFCSLVSARGSAPMLWSQYFCAGGQEQIYLLQRNRPVTWSALIHQAAEDFIRSLPKNRERQ